MPLAPCPHPLPSALTHAQAVPTERRLHCAWYATCLHQAVKRGWGGWTCRHCPLRDGAGERRPRAHDFARAQPRGYEAS